MHYKTQSTLLRLNSCQIDLEPSFSLRMKKWFIRWVVSSCTRRLIELKHQWQSSHYMSQIFRRRKYWLNCVCVLTDLSIKHVSQKPKQKDLWQSLTSVGFNWPQTWQTSLCGTTCWAFLWHQEPFCNNWQHVADRKHEMCLYLVWEQRFLTFNLSMQLTNVEEWMVSTSILSACWILNVSFMSKFSSTQESVSPQVQQCFWIEAE